MAAAGVSVQQSSDQAVIQEAAKHKDTYVLVVAHASAVVSLLVSTAVMPSVVILLLTRC